MSIQIFPLFYKNEGKKIGLKTYPDNAMKEVLRKCGLLKYSKTYKSWYLPYDKGVFEKLKLHFPDLEILADKDTERTEHEAAPLGTKKVQESLKGVYQTDIVSSLEEKKNA